MNPLEKTLILKKINAELEALDELKGRAFKKMFAARVANDDKTHSKMWVEYCRLTDKMEGVSLCRALILNADYAEALQERPDKNLNKQSLHIVSSDRTE